MSQCMKISNRIFLILISLMMNRPLASQSFTTGDVVGIVTDPSGAVVPAATVTLTSQEKGATLNNTTGAQGVYRFSLLQPGGYLVSAEAQGFESTTRALIVSLGQSTFGDLTLKIASAKTTL